MIICEICKKQFTRLGSLGAHVSTIHKIPVNIYYNQYLKTDENDGICHNPNCTHSTKFISLSAGYQKYCSPNCAHYTNGILQKNKTLEEKEAISLKRKQTMQDRYGVDYASQTEANRQSVESPQARQKAQMTYQQTCLDKYNTTNFFGSEIGKEMAKQGKISKYGKAGYNGIEKYKDDIDKMHAIKEKEFATKKQNHTFNSSQPEELLYTILKQLYGESEVKRQYKSTQYNYYCDFYITSLNLYCECNFSWTHGEHAYNPIDINDINKLKEIQQKGTSSDYYKNAITTWTIRDVNKKLDIINNKLNALIIYPTHCDLYGKVPQELIDIIYNNFLFDKN